MLLDIFSVLFILTIFLYLLQTVFIFVGLGKLKYQRTEILPPISILVALKDEALTLSACIESLLKLDYPNELLQIILINDRSQDETPAIINSYKEKSELIKIVNIDKTIAGLSGKANAICQGIEHADGEIMLITDGDSEVPPSWAKAHASYYRDNVGLVGGFTLLDRKNDATSFFGKIQSLDWAYLLSIGAGAMGLGKPLSVLGNNFSFRKSAYDEVGGYRNMGFTIIEDFALMRTLVKKTTWKVLYPINPDMLVYSQPMQSWRTFQTQRKRWSAGGKEVGIYGKFLMAVSLLTHLAIPSSFWANNLTLALIGTSIVLGADLILLVRSTKIIERNDLLKFFPIWELFYFFYTIFFTPVLLFPTTVQWKNVSYSWRFNWQIKNMIEKKAIQ